MPRSRRRNAIGLALLAFLGCEVADLEVVRQGTGTIPRNGNSADMMRLDGMELVLAELEDTEGIGREDVSDATLERMWLEVLDPAPADLAFADRIEVYAEAPELGRVRVAYQERFPAGARLVELETVDVDLRDYIAAPRVTLTAVVDGEMPQTDVRVRATAELSIGVTLRGACDHAR